jgi:hypothetical protein
MLIITFFRRNEMIATKTKRQAHELGTNHTNTMANKNGLDEIDLWAMGVGQAERQIHQMTPRKRHKATII